MKRTKSKLDLASLQLQFDALLDSFTSEDVNAWKQHDMKLQGDKLFNGKTIEVVSNPVSYLPTSCEISDLAYRSPKDTIDYGIAA